MESNDQEPNTGLEPPESDLPSQASPGVESEHNVKWRSPIVLLVVGVLVILLVAAGIYLGLVYLQPATSTSVTTYAQSGVPLSFSYPTGWQVRTTTQAGDPTTTYYNLTLFPGKVTSTGDPEQAAMIIARWENTSNTPLEQAVRTAANDTQHLLVFSPCQFHNPYALECLEIADQTAWVNAGKLPVQAVVFFRIPNAIYAISWGQADTFNFQQGTGQDILRTLQFGTSH